RRRGAARRPGAWASAPTSATLERRALPSLAPFADDDRAQRGSPIAADRAHCRRVALGAARTRALPLAVVRVAGVERRHVDAERRRGVADDLAHAGAGDG